MMGFNSINVRRAAFPLISVAGLLVALNSANAATPSDTTGATPLGGINALDTNLPDCSQTSPPTCNYVGVSQTVTVTPTAFTTATPACEVVTNKNCPQPIMVPTGSQLEWSSFINSNLVGSLGCASIAACSGGSQSGPSGGGTGSSTCSTDITGGSDSNIVSYNTVSEFDCSPTEAGGSTAYWCGAGDTGESKAPNGFVSVGYSGTTVTGPIESGVPSSVPGGGQGGGGSPINLGDQAAAICSLKNPATPYPIYYHVNSGFSSAQHAVWIYLNQDYTPTNGAHVCRGFHTSQQGSAGFQGGQRPIDYVICGSAPTAYDCPSIANGAVDPGTQVPVFVPTGYNAIPNGFDGDYVPNSTFLDSMNGVMYICQNSQWQLNLTCPAGYYSSTYDNGNLPAGYPGDYHMPVNPRDRGNGQWNCTNSGWSFQYGGT